MIAYLKGEITFKTPDQIILDVNGVGYLLKISLFTYAKIEKEERTKLYTHYHVNTQDMKPSMYGFATEMERNTFHQLIDVKGISVNSARVILSAMPPDEVRAAIISENEGAFKAVKGIGAKTAKQIILDLKDKMLKDGGEAPTVFAPANNTLRTEALAALTALQINKIQAQKTLNLIFRENPNVKSVEEVIRLALRQLG